MDIPQNIFNQYKSNLLKNSAIGSEINLLEKEIYGFSVEEQNASICAPRLTEFSLDHLEGVAELTEFKERLELVLMNGGGLCILVLGVINDNEIGISSEQESKSFWILNSICSELELVHKVMVTSNGPKGKILEIKITAITLKYNPKSTKPEVKIGLFGEESCGKSTLIGVLVNGLLDDGNGHARSNIYRFQHEQYSGKTSNFSHYIAGLNEKGELINSETLPNKNSTDSDSKSRLLWEDVIHYSMKIISLYDMGGSSKLTLSLFSAKYIDYFCLIINPVIGLADNTRTYLKLAIKLNLPIFVVITAADLVEPKILENLFQDLKLFIKSIRCEWMPIQVNNQKDAVLFSRNIEEGIIPIIAISSKTGEGIVCLVSFLNALEANKHNVGKNEETMFDIHEHFYTSANKKVVVAGFVSKGKLSLGQKCYLGPNKQGQFSIIEVEGLHCKKIPTKSAFKGQFVTVCLKKEGLTSDQIRKGMVLLDLKTKPRQVKTFECELYSLDSHDKNIKYKFEPVVNIRNIRHCCKLKKQLADTSKSVHKSDKYADDEEERVCFSLEGKIYKSSPSTSTLNTSSYNNYNNLSSYTQFGDYLDQQSHSKDIFTLKEYSKVTVKLEFKNYTEYIEKGDVIIVNEPYMRAFGLISKCEQT